MLYDYVQVRTELTKKIMTEQEAEKLPFVPNKATQIAHYKDGFLCCYVSIHSQDESYRDKHHFLLSGDCAILNNIFNQIKEFDIEEGE